MLTPNDKGNGSHHYDYLRDSAYLNHDDQIGLGSKFGLGNNGMNQGYISTNIFNCLASHIMQKCVTYMKEVFFNAEYESGFKNFNRNLKNFIEDSEVDSKISHDQISEMSQPKNFREETNNIFQDPDSSTLQKQQSGEGPKRPHDKGHHGLQGNTQRGDMGHIEDDMIQSFDDMVQGHENQAKAAQSSLNIPQVDVGKPGYSSYGEKHQMSSPPHANEGGALSPFNLDNEQKRLKHPTFHMHGGNYDEANGAEVDTSKNHEMAQGEPAQLTPESLKA